MMKILKRISPARTSDQRLIETITGRSTILFRPPYNADSRPSAPEEIMPLKLAQELGYLTVSEDIDPEDWETPGVEVILERVKQSRRLGGHIILLHDAGGDRQQRRAAGFPKTGFSPSLSVLIAAYNEEAVIAKTLQSVLTTTYPGDISVWVVDDGSADKTASVVETFSSKEMIGCV